MKTTFKLVTLISMLSLIILVGVVFSNRQLLTLYSSSSGDNMDKSFIEIFNEADSVDIIIDGERSEGNLEGINNIMSIVLEGSHEMPAFGVSLDNETRSAMNSGVWIEYIYDKTYSHNDMTFDSLLIEVQPDWSGFNIIRKINDKYEGRCFYISLNGSMQALYDYIQR